LQKTGSLGSLFGTSGTDGGKWQWQGEQIFPTARCQTQTTRNRNECQWINFQTQTTIRRQSGKEFTNYQNADSNQWSSTYIVYYCMCFVLYVISY
jgi:hypothetical protein